MCLWVKIHLHIPWHCCPINWMAKVNTFSGGRSCSVSYLVVTFVTYTGMVVIRKNTIQKDVHTHWVEDSSKLALSVSDQLFFCVSLWFYRSWTLWVGFSFPLLFKLHLILPSIFFLQLFFALSSPPHTSSSLHLMPPSKENRNHDRLCSERTQARIEIRHLLYLMLESHCPWELSHALPNRASADASGQALSMIHCFWFGSQNSSGGYQNSPN